MNFGQKKKASFYYQAQPSLPSIMELNYSTWQQHLDCSNLLVLCLQGRGTGPEVILPAIQLCRAGHVWRMTAIPVRHLCNEVAWDLQKPGGGSQPSKIHWSQSSNTVAELCVAEGKKKHWQASLVYKHLGKGSLSKLRLGETRNLRAELNKHWQGCKQPSTSLFGKWRKGYTSVSSKINEEEFLLAIIFKTKNHQKEQKKEKCC